MAHPDPQPQRPAGVYDAVKPRADVLPADLYVPPFLGREFFAFLARFCADPAANPVFVREWRRNLRRLGPLAPATGAPRRRWALLALLGASAMLLPAIAGVAVVRSVDSATAQAVLLAAMLMLPVALAAVWGFFASLQSADGLMGRASLEEMTLAGLRPQEIVFGHLAGSLLPLTIPALLLVPGVALMGFDLAVRDPVGGLPGPLTALAVVVAFYPVVAASMLWSGAVAATVTYAEERAGLAAAKAIATWLVVAGSIHFPLVQFLGPLLLLGSDSLAIVAVLALPLALLKVAVAAGFLHHLAVRLARKAAEE